MIRNIIFDFGGILIDIDYDKTNTNLGKLLGVRDINVFPFNEIMEAYEVGAFGEEAFFRLLKEHSKEMVGDEELRIGWNSMLGELPISRLEMTHSLQQQFRVFLLSNTNYTHIEFVRDLLKQQYGITNFESKYFHEVYYSHEVRLRKPGGEIYNFVLTDAGLNPAETLFIDDSTVNVEGAASVGINARVHNPAIDITKMIHRYLES